MGSPVVAIRRHYAKGLIGVIVAALGACFYVYVSNVRMLDTAIRWCRCRCPPRPDPTLCKEARLADLTGCTDCIVRICAAACSSMKVGCTDATTPQSHAESGSSDEDLAGSFGSACVGRSWDGCDASSGLSV